MTTEQPNPATKHPNDPASQGLDWNVGPPSPERQFQRATYTADEVASLLGVSTWAVYQAAKGDTLAVPPLRIGRRLVWPRHLVDQSLGIA